MFSCVCVAYVASPPRSPGARPVGRWDDIVMGNSFMIVAFLAYPCYMLDLDCGNGIGDDRDIEMSRKLVIR